jgi:hypothetical protein
MTIAAFGFLDDTDAEGEGNIVVEALKRLGTLSLPLKLFSTLSKGGLLLACSEKWSCSRRLGCFDVFGVTTDGGVNMGGVVNRLGILL